MEGKALYRKFCGQCHALSAARAAGFGCNDRGLGTDGGLSFNNPNVPHNSGPGDYWIIPAGHEIVIKKMDFPQIYAVSAFTAAATSSNPYLARESDGLAPGRHLLSAGESPKA